MSGAPENPLAHLRLAVDNPEPADRPRGGGGPGSGDAPPAPDLAEFSEDRLAAAFTKRHGDELLYLKARGTWLRDVGTHYRADETQWVEDRARQACIEVADTAPNKSTAERLASKRTVAAVVALASADRVHATEVADLDTDPMLLNTPGGIVDLRTGQLGPHRRAARMTRVAAAAPAGEAPRWRRFLAEVTGGDADVAAYLQRIAGYCLTGSVVEHALFFVYGPGGNGKSVFIETLAHVLGDYATVAPIDVFTVSKGERHPTELALLAGARLVIASETEEGRRWDEAKLKAITGGDKITARFMRQDFFTFEPTFKLLMAGNYRPSIRSVDTAMQRRVNMIPFTQKIAAPDKGLLQQLRAEAGGILQWMIDGCLAWQRDGLAPPDAVQQATREYFDTEDVLGRWLQECCEQDANAAALTGDLFKSFKGFAVENGEYAGSERRLSQMLQQRGFERWQHPKNRKRGFRGVAVRDAGDTFDFERPNSEASHSGFGKPNEFGDRWPT